MKRRTILRSLARILLFLLILHFAVWWLGIALYNLGERKAEKSPGMSYDYASYYFGRAPRDSYDTVFIGSSHQYCGVDVNLLNREFGARSILLTSSAQNLKLSYYAALEAIELQHPDTIVLEAMYAAEEREEPADLAKWTFLDLMPNWTRTKAAAVRATGDEAYLYYYPLSALHNNWPELRAEDFKLPPRLAPGECYCYRYDPVKPLEPWEPLPPEKKAPMPEAARRWLDALVSLCEREGISLILYIAPFVAPEDRQEVYNGLADYAAERGLPYYNLLHRMDEIGLDPAADFFDEGHLNRSGQIKLTRWLGEQVLK